MNPCIALRLAGSRRHKKETRRKKLAAGRKFWELFKVYAEGYGDQPYVHLDVHEFQRDWLARGERCMLDWYDKVDAKRDLLMKLREARQRTPFTPPVPPKPKTRWERITDWLLTKILGAEPYC